jgi:hypothetical protein
VSLLPVTRRTWAPRGHTPVIGHHFNWSAPRWLPRVCYGSRAGGAAVAFYHHPDAYDTDGLIGALGQLRRFLGGSRRPCGGAGSPPHRSKLMRAWLRRQRPWLVVEPLPAYAPSSTRSRGCEPASRAWS